MFKCLDIQSRGILGIKLQVDSPAESAAARVLTCGIANNFINKELPV